MDIVSYPMSFTILKLPFIPLRNILQNFNYLEILDFSFVSKKCQYVTQSTKFGNFEVSLSLQSERSPIVFYQKYRFLFKFSVDDLNNRTKYMKRNVKSNQFITEQDPSWVEMAKEWTDYICGLFRKDVGHLFLSSNGSFEEVLSITEWINKRQSTLEYCEFYGDRTNSESIELFFQKAEFSIHRLSLELRQPSLIKPLKFKRLNMTELFATSSTSKYPVDWLTVDDMINSDCGRIMIEACSFNENDINRIIKGWLKGNNPRMEFFTVASKLFDFELVLDGIEFEKKNDPLQRSCKFEFIKDQIEYQFDGGFDIRRKDGRLATIQQRNYFQSETPMFRFVMVVWPDE